MIGVVMVSEENNILLPRPALATGDIGVALNQTRRRPPITDRRMNDQYLVSSASTTANPCIRTSRVLHARGHGYRSNRSCVLLIGILSRLCCILLYIVIDTIGSVICFEWMILFFSSFDPCGEWMFLDPLVFLDEY